MWNVWGFLLQTLAASLVAALILFLKWLFTDKLSPRWQYGVWIVLLLRILLPIQPDRALFVSLPMWLETIKMTVEQSLQSVYTDAFVPIVMNRMYPVVVQEPVSITDWLFVAYVVGVVLMLLWYVIGYVRLRMLLRKGTAIDEEQQQIIDRVCAKYQLPCCDTVAVDGLPSAFICGVIRPVLALPADESVDEKIVLHELLHLQHKDAWRNVVWAVLRALHWCNPFLQTVFNRIGNDMESLCDQRVLERLEGEERRAYGNILLDMANDRYARAPGTTSISNGGKNISRRIAAIVRFKKYPQGMALVSVCIVLVLAVPALAGTEQVYEQDVYEPQTLQQLDKAMAVVRLNRCSTVAGALDTYAKGLILENGVYISAVTPTEEHEALYNTMKANGRAMTQKYHLDSGKELEAAAPYRVSYNGHDDLPYKIYSLYEEEDGSYTATLAFRIGAYLGENNTVYQNGCVLVPVCVYKADGWLVKEVAPRIIMPEPFDGYMTLDLENEPALRTYTVRGETGEVRLKIVAEYVVDNERVQSNGVFRDTTFDFSMKPHAQFDYLRDMYHLRYDSNKRLTEAAPKTYVGYRMKVQWDENNDLQMEQEQPKRESHSNASVGDGEGFEVERSDWYSVTMPPEIPNEVSYGSSSTDYSSMGIREVWHQEWDGILQGGSGSGVYEPDTAFRLPYQYHVGIYWDGKLVEVFTLEEGVHNE